MKKCPHCKAPVPPDDLFTISMFKSSYCFECDKYYKNAKSSGFLTIAAIVVSVVLFEYIRELLVPYDEVLFLIYFLVVAVLSITLLAKPVPYERKDEGCPECGRTNVGYYSRLDSICSECMDSRKNL